MKKTKVLSLLSVAISVPALFFSQISTASAEDDKDAMVSVKAMADAIHMVVDADRAVYTRKIVHRLAKKEKVIKASEHFEDDKALALPAQMFRMGAERVAEKVEKDPNVNFSYSLQSLWPINEQNEPKTDAEKEGLKFVADNKGKNFYTTETLGDKKYYTAVYADTAVAPVCVSCHNDHKDSPKTDFKIGDVMGEWLFGFLWNNSFIKVLLNGLVRP